MIRRAWKSWSSLFSRIPIIVSCFITFLFFGIFLLQYIFSSTSFFSSFSFLLHPDKNIFAVLERASFDKKIRERKNVFVSDKIVVIEIGESTLEKLGTYPFNRKVYSALLRKLEESGVKVAAFDIVFAEKERVDGDKKNGSLSDGDEFFAKSLRLKDMSVVFGYFFKRFGLTYEAVENIESHLTKGDRFQKEESLLDITHVLMVGEASADLKEIKEASGIHFALDPVFPAPELFQYVDTSRNNIGFGFFNSTPDSDRVLRKISLITFYNGYIYSSLALRAVELFLEERAVVSIPDSGFASSVLYFPGQDASIPIDHYGKIWINYINSYEDDFATYEFADILPKSAGGRGKIGKKELSGKLVFIGASSLGVMNVHSTPFSSGASGVKVNAGVANSIIESSYIRDDPYYFWVGFLALSIGSLLYLFFVMLISPVYSIPLTFGIIFVLQQISSELFFSKSIIIPVVMITAQYSLILFFSIIYRFLLVDKEKRFTKEAFSHFISPVVVDSILGGHKKLALGGEKKDISVLFADLEGFTTISDRVDDSLVSEFMNTFFTSVSKIIRNNRGVLDKYTGDGVMCFWGAPMDEEEHARLACEVALQVEAAVKGIEKEWKVRLKYPIHVRIGISSGKMIVGNVGSKDAFNYTVLGDKVNLGSRLENLNKSYGTHIIVSENTYELCKEDFVFRCLDFVQVKGRHRFEHVYELVDHKFQEKKWSEWISAFERARLLYKEENLEEARLAFQLCCTLHPKDKASLVFLDRIEEQMDSSGSSKKSAS